MNDNNSKPAATKQPTELVQMGPDDTFVALVIPQGTQQVAVFTDGKKTELEYCMMILSVLNSMFVQFAAGETKKKSPIIDPFAGLRVRG